MKNWILLFLAVAVSAQTFKFESSNPVLLPNTNISYSNNTVIINPEKNLAGHAVVNVFWFDGDTNYYRLTMSTNSAPTIPKNVKIEIIK